MYGKPRMYKITFEGSESGPGAKLIEQSTTREVKFHWTRVIHIADNLLSSEYIGTPAMLPVANDLQDIKKIYGASGEGY